MKAILDFSFIVWSTGAIWLYVIAPITDWSLEGVFFGWGMSVVIVYVIHWLGGIWRMTNGR